MTPSENPSATQTTEELDPRCIAIKPDGPLPVGDEIVYPNYSDEEHDIWKTLYARQKTLLPGRAADEFLVGLEALDLDKERVPTLASVSKQLKEATDWQICRTPGLLDAPIFFGYLARRIFPCTDYVRSRAELDYTPAPDCFHDIFGHTPMIMHPRFADFYQKLGKAALACKDPETEEGITRIYWFTVEFGLIKNPAGLRIYGNGIISSYGETKHSLTDKVEKHPFVPEKTAAQPYDIWHFQDVLWIVDSFEHLEEEFDRWARSKNLL